MQKGNQSCASGDLDEQHQKQDIEINQTLKNHIFSSSLFFTTKQHKAPPRFYGEMFRISGIVCWSRGISEG